MPAWGYALPPNAYNRRLSPFAHPTPAFMTTAPSSSLPDEHARSAMLARQAIVNSAQKVVGFELFNRSQLHGGHTAASDVLMVFTALSHAGSEELVGKVPIFVNCTHESLSGGHLELVNPEKMVLEIPPLGHLADSEVQARLPVLEQLRARGFHLAFSHSVLESAYAAWLPLANYIKIDLSVLRAGFSWSRRPAARASL